jgi:tripartite-type tricarboxylate transporter receptor subunit TctC
MAEAGLDGQEADTFQALLVPTGTPTAVVDRLQQAVRALVASADAKALFSTLGFDPVASTPDAFRTQIASEIAKWRKVARDSGIKVE